MCLIPVLRKNDEVWLAPATADDASEAPAQAAVTME